MRETVGGNSLDPLLREPVPRLVRTIGIPAAVGFLFNTGFNVVDTWYAGMLSTSTLAALSLSFPLFFIIIAFTEGFSVGVTAVVGNEYGAGRETSGRFVSAQVFSLGIILSLLLTLVGELAASPLFHLLGADGDYLSKALAYMRIIFAGALFFLFNGAINGILRAHGDTKSYRNVLIAGFLLNLLLDPLFIFGWLGIPRMGIRGLAFATILVQALGMSYMLYRLQKYTRFAGAHRHDFLPRPSAWLQLLGQGVPATLNSLTVGVGIFVITWFLGQFGERAVAAYGAAVRIEQIALLPTIGISTAVLSISARNSGAALFHRVKETEISALKYGLVLLVPAAFFLLAAPVLVGFFSSDQEVIAIGARYLRIDSLTLYAYVVLSVHVSLLQGLKRPRFAIAIGLFRQLLVPVPLFWLLSKTAGLGVSGVFWGIFAVTWMAAVIAALYCRHILSEYA
ncbi:MATE family efflux transporter [Sediminispirochaeta bajacaliforniensis]|uniref:MATE family efflux transporter n=1 Tax=Sediminispirochaeta bajacaliforniensis TaxID=148 RepID=UPI000372DFE2|nr:MATE family efflux transporter [Sediminispirochaeta bajacaliforniensis]